MIVVERVGPAALVQDLGRPDHAGLGVSPSGAADRAALRLANRLVGNAEGAAGLEVLLGGLALTATALHWVALTGARVPAAVDGRAVGSQIAVALRPGQRLELGEAPSGLRCYLAVRGGLAVAPVLGSRSTDTLSGLGPAPLRAGDRLPVGTAAHPLPGADAVVAPTPPDRLHLHPGPRRDWFSAAAWERLLTTTWTVRADSDRVAARLDGPVLERIDTRELASEGLLRGAVQVPASGRPLVFLSDHPTTGGYPVIAVLDDEDVDHLAQRRPGDSVRFAVASRSTPLG